MKIIRLCMGIALTAIASRAATVRPMALDALIAQSDYVVYVRVLGSHSFWDSETTTIWTQTEFLVLDSAKGHAAQTVRVIEPGGVLGSVAHLFPGVPSFEANQELVLFLNKDPAGRTRVLGLQQGVYRVLVDEGTGERSVRPVIQPPEVVHLEGQPSTPQTRTPVAERRLVEFLNLIREKASVR